MVSRYKIGDFVQLNEEVLNTDERVTGCTRHILSRYIGRKHMVVGVHSEGEFYTLEHVRGSIISEVLLLPYEEVERKQGLQIGDTVEVCSEQEMLEKFLVENDDMLDYAYMVLQVVETDGHRKYKLHGGGGHWYDEAMLTFLH